MSTPFFEYQHVVGFEESNLVGNVYYVNHLRWQGRCREMFLREHCPDVLEELSQGLALVTVRCSCQYFAELVPFDVVSIRMRLDQVVQNRVAMLFDYVRVGGGAEGKGTQEELIAKGEQEIGCMRRQGEVTVPVPVPVSLREALEPYAVREGALS